MGKIVLCSNTEQQFDIVSNFEKMGFVKSYSAIGKFGEVCAFSKLNVKTRNVAMDGEDFAIGVGTFIYNKKIDNEALQDILIDFKTEGIKTVRNKILGSFALFILVNNECYIFVDRNHTYNLYYTLKDGNIILTNTYSHIAKATSCKVNEIALVERMFKFSNLSNETPFYDIKKLLGDEMLYFSSSWELREDINEYDGISNGLWEKVSEDFKGINEIFHSPSVFMTGGQDSRICLAIMMHEKMKPTLYYGVGNSIRTWTKPEDFQIVKEIAKENSLPLHIMDWSDVEITEEEREKYLSKYGEGVYIYGCNKNIIEMLENNLENDYIGLGYFGEIYRNTEGIVLYDEEKFSLGDYVKNLYLDDKLKDCYKNYSSYERKIYEKLTDICKRKNINISFMSKEDHQKIDTEYRKSADVVMNNFINLFMYSMPFLGEKKYTDYSEAYDYEGKNNSKWIIEGIEYLYDSLLYIPFFSHLKKQKYFKGKKVLLDQNKHIETLRKIIKKSIKNASVLNALRRGYHLIVNDKKGNDELSREEIYKSKLCEELSHDMMWENFDLGKMSKRYDSTYLGDMILTRQIINYTLKSYQKER